jgi:hypothetical protein
VAVAERPDAGRNVMKTMMKALALAASAALLAAAPAMAQK